MERPDPQQILATTNWRNNLIYGDKRFISSEKPIIKKRNEQITNSEKEKTELMFVNLKKDGLNMKNNDKVTIHPKKIASPPILTMGTLWFFLELGKSKIL